MDHECLYEHYLAEINWLDHQVAAGLRDALLDLRKEFHNKFPHIACPKPPECRVKRFDRICEKVRGQGKTWPHKELFLIKASEEIEVIVNDLIAGRVVCAVPKDVERLTELLTAWPARFIEPAVENKDDRSTGYRACHIDTAISVYRGPEQVWFPVEVQIKTLLQDAWANFGHDEFYKSSDELPTVSQEISLHLADTLASLDLIGQAIREEKLRKLEAPPYIAPEETLVTSRTLNYLANEIFNEPMSILELQRCVAQLRAFGYDNLAVIDEMARDPRIANAVTVAKAKNGVLGEITPFEILFFGPLATKENQEALENQICRLYGLTGETCAICQGPIHEADKEFIQNKTDLDSTLICENCRRSQLKACTSCGVLTQSGVCKDCRSKKAETEIL